MNCRQDTGAFVLATKAKPTRYFGVRGFDTALVDSPTAVEVVVFHRDRCPGRKSAMCRSGWHAELWDRLTKRSSAYQPERLPDKPKGGL